MYEPIDEIAANPFLTELVRRDMQREWKALYRRYSQFEEFRAMVSGDVVAAS